MITFLLVIGWALAFSSQFLKNNIAKLTALAGVAIFFSALIYLAVDTQIYANGYRIKTQTQSLLTSSQYQTFKAKDCTIVVVDKDNIFVAKKLSFNVWKIKTVLNNNIEYEDYKLIEK
jgi:hypothetical protein